MKIDNKVIHHSNNIIKNEYILFIHSNTISFIYLYRYKTCYTKLHNNNTIYYYLIRFKKTIFRIIQCIWRQN